MERVEKKTEEQKKKLLTESALSLGDLVLTQTMQELSVFPDRNI